MGKLWQKITHRRYQSELFALRLALRAPLLAPLLIGAVLCFWWVIVPLPLFIPIVLVLKNLGPFGDVVLGIVIPMMLLPAAPWLFGWYFGWSYIAASVMFGRTSLAKAREEALARAIDANRAKFT